MPFFPCVSELDIKGLLCREYILPSLPSSLGLNSLKIISSKNMFQALSFPTNLIILDLCKSDSMLNTALNQVLPVSFDSKFQICLLKNKEMA